MKVGIMTFYQCYNYGALLQAYAMQEYVRGLDPHMVVELINFKNTQTGSILGIPFDQIRNLPLFCKTIISKLIDIPFILPKKKNFDLFRKKYINIAPKRYRKYSELKNDPPPYDVYICGSDQIWNPEIEPKAKPAYFLKFVGNKKAKKISYAASIGISKIDARYMEDYKDYLKDMDAISVREQGAVKVLSGLTDKSISRNVDPALLLTLEQWDKIAADTLIHEKYMLVYMLGHKRSVIDLANRIANRLHLKIVHFGPYRTYDNEIARFHCVGPDVFVSLLRNAELVVTNSFHGTAFSIIYQKKFYSVITSKVGSRISGLLEILHLEDRIISQHEDITDLDQEIDYEKVTEILEKERSYSKQYLTEAIFAKTIEVENKDE